MISAQAYNIADGSVNKLGDSGQVENQKSVSTPSLDNAGILVYHNARKVNVFRVFASRRFLKGYILLGVAVLGVALLIYSLFLIRGLEEDTKSTSRIFARFCATLPGSEAGSDETEIIFDEVIRKIDFPVIYTDRNGNPQAWRNIGGEDPSVEKIGEIAKKLDSQGACIPLKVGQDSLLVGYVYYGIPRLTKLLRLAPVFLLGMTGFFIVIAFLGFRAIKDSEQNFVWLGMAKETAHQFGTPLSSLSGWIEYLKKKSDLGDIIIQMEHDLSRLYKVSSRFSRIGAQPKLTKKPLKPVLRSTVDYFRNRMGKNIVIKETYSDLPDVELDEELFSWAIENLVRNSRDAIDGSGVVEVSAETDHKRKCVVISVHDSGRGMSKEEQRKIFKPGYTTKEFGWGLGLPLAKRIIESHHNGKLRLKESQTGQGSTFQISIPVNEG